MIRKKFAYRGPSLRAQRRLTSLLSPPRSVRSALGRLVPFMAMPRITESIILDFAILFTWAKPPLFIVLKIRTPGSLLTSRPGSLFSVPTMLPLP